MEESKKTAIRVGVFVILTSLTFVSLIAYVSRWQVKRAGYTIDVKFAFLNNLAVNAPVKIAGGIPVGYVKDIYQKNLETYVRIYLDEDLKGKIPKRPETIITIFSASLMGQKYINIEIPEEQEDDVYFEEGDEWVGIDPPSIDQMMLAFSSWFDGQSGGQVLAQIMQETKLFISNLNAITGENRKDIRLTVKTARESFTTLSEQLDVLMGKLTILSSNFTEISTRNKQDIEVMLKNLAQITEDMNLITQRINSGRGSVGKFVSDEDLYNNANEAILNAKELFQVIKEQPWKLLYKE